MRKVNKRSQRLRHYNSGAKSIGYFSKLKNLFLGFFTTHEKKSFYVNHEASRYESYSLPSRQGNQRQAFSLNHLKKYFTHAGLIAVAGFTILSNNCFGSYCNDYNGTNNVAMANQLGAAEDIIEIDVATGENTGDVINNQEKDNIAAYVADYAAPDAKKELINRTIQAKQSGDEDHDIAIIQDSYLDKVNSPVTTVSDISRKNVIVHIVKADETLWSIADKYQLSTDTIEWSNGMDNSGVVIEGQELYIIPMNGIYYTVAEGDNLSSIAEKYKSDVEEIKKWNDVGNGISAGQKIILPGGQVPPPPAPVTVVNNSSNSNNSSYNYTAAPDYSAAPGGAGTGQFGWPTSGMTITQYFGATSFNPWHTGIDIDSRSGWDIFASDSGTVTTAVYGWGGGYGNHVIIDHGNGYQTLYGHLSALDVSVGQYVSQGQRIGTMGSTGWSTGPHLHFEIRYGGSYLNPLNYL
ncbi:MAG: M23 family metallopeptidase [Patescibacteria group bacterium]